MRYQLLGINGEPMAQFDKIDVAFALIQSVNSMCGELQIQLDDGTYRTLE